MLLLSASGLLVQTLEIDTQHSMKVKLMALFVSEASACLLEKSIQKQVPREWDLECVRRGQRQAREVVRSHPGWEVENKGVVV